MIMFYVLPVYECVLNCSLTGNKDILQDDEKLTSNFGFATLVFHGRVNSASGVRQGGHWSWVWAEGGGVIPWQ